MAKKDWNTGPRYFVFFTDGDDAECRTMKEVKELIKKVSMDTGFKVRASSVAYFPGNGKGCTKRFNIDWAPTLKIAV